MMKSAVFDLELECGFLESSEHPKEVFLGSIDMRRRPARVAPAALTSGIYPLASTAVLDLIKISFKYSFSFLNKHQQQKSYFERLNILTVKLLRLRLFHNIFQCRVFTEEIKDGRALLCKKQELELSYFQLF